jgi:ParE-like toxin of type II bacterial toxin-antitoxin system
MIFSQTAIFEKNFKKLHMNQKENIYKAIREIVKNPLIGDQKKGDLSMIRVYKFYIVNQLILLAYKYDAEESLILVAFWSHENFYRDLKKQVF